MSPFWLYDAQDISHQDDQAAPKYFHRKSRASRVKKMESTIKTLITINLIFMSILHLYMFCRSESCWNLFRAGQQQKYPSNSIVVNSTLLLGRPQGPGILAAEISKTEKAMDKGPAFKANTSMQEPEHTGFAIMSMTERAGKAESADSTIIINKDPTPRSNSEVSSSELLLLGGQVAQTPMEKSGKPELRGAQPGELLISRSDDAGQIMHPDDKKRKQNSDLGQNQAFAPQQQGQPEHEQGTLQNVHKIIFSPHYDDAVLSLGGMLSVDPTNTTVITVFAGKPMYPVTTAYDESCLFSSSDQALNVRSGENRRALENLGITFRDLEYIDFQYASFYWSWLQPTYTRGVGYGAAPRIEYRVVDPLELRKKRRDDLRVQLAADIKKILESYLRTDNTRVEVYSSLGKAASDHADHEILHLAIMDLALSMKNGANVTMGSNSGVTWLFYEDFPYVLRYADDSVKRETLLAEAQASKARYGGHRESLRARAELQASNMRATASLAAGSEWRQGQFQGSKVEISSIPAPAVVPKTLHGRIEAAIHEFNIWANTTTFVPKMQTYNRLHYQRKKAAIKMYRSQVSDVCMHVCMYACIDRRLVMSVVCMYV
jgi:hypothetical protein